MIILPLLFAVISYEKIITLCVVWIQDECDNQWDRRNRATTKANATMWDLNIKYT